MKNRGYMCNTTFENELGFTPVMVFPTVEALKKSSPCWEECGIVAVEFSTSEIIIKSII